MLQPTKLLLFLLLSILVHCAPKRDVMIKVAQKLNEMLPHFSQVLEVGVNENNELGLYTTKDIEEDEVIFT